MAQEKKRGKEEAGLINRYKVFAKMQTAEDFEVLVDGLICKSQSRLAGKKTGFEADTSLQMSRHCERRSPNCRIIGEMA